MKRWYYASFQTIALFAVMPFLGINLQKNGIRHLIGEFKTGENRRKLMIDAALMLTHFGIFLVLPALIWGAGASITLYLLRMALMSVCLFVILVPAHFVREAPVLSQEEAAQLDYCQLQTMTAVNVNGGWLLRWYSSGLDYQIEHHLLPDLSHSQYPRIQPIVRKFCQDHGLPYRVLSLGQAMKGSLGVFRRPKAVGLDAVPDLVPAASEAK